MLKRQMNLNRKCPGRWALNGVCLRVFTLYLISKDSWNAAIQGLILNKMTILAAV